MSYNIYKLKWKRLSGSSYIDVATVNYAFPYGPYQDDISGMWNTWPVFMPVLDTYAQGALGFGCNAIYSDSDTTTENDLHGLGIPTLPDGFQVNDRLYFKDTADLSVYMEIYEITGNTVKFHYCRNGTVLLELRSANLSSYFSGNQRLTINYLPWLMASAPTIYANYALCQIYGSYDYRNGYFRYAGITPLQLYKGINQSTLATASDFRDWLMGVNPVDVNDPYMDIPDSEPSGPAQGTGIPTNDPVAIPGLPTASAIDTGFISLFNPTLAQVRDLADFMWTNTLFDINNLKKIFANPMDCILGFNMVPVEVPSGGAASVTVGNIVSTVSMNVATSQWVEKDCGSLNIDQWIGNYMDFAPDSKYSIYLPYIGIRELSTDDLVGKTVKLVYHVDVLSCSCLAFLKCGDSVLYEFAGQCGYSIPVTNNDFTQMIANICRLAIGVGGAVAGGGMSASGVGNMVDSVMGLKPEVHRSGSVGGSTGLMGGQTPYLIMELPNLCKPTKQYHYLGYPSFVTKTLGDLTGFASFESVILDGISCTDEERQIILAMCREGIYL